MVKTKATTTRGAKSAFASYVATVGAGLDYHRDVSNGGRRLQVEGGCGAVVAAHEREMAEKEKEIELLKKALAAALQAALRLDPLLQQGAGGGGS